MNKINFSFYELDKHFYKIFTDKALLEKTNKIGDGVNYFQAIQNNVFEAMRVKLLGGKINFFLHSIKILVRSNGIDHKIKKNINKLLFKKYNTSIAENSIILFCENFVPHILNDFIKISNAISKNSSVVFVSTDFRAYNYMQKKADSTMQLHLMNTFISNNKCYSILKKRYTSFFKQLKVTSNADNNYYNEIENIFFKNLKILHLFSNTFDYFLEINKPKAIFLGSDGFSISRTLIYSARKKNCLTYVFQHGLINSFNGYLPLVADKIFVWSNYDKVFLEQNHIKESKIVVVGAPRFIKKNNEITTKISSKKINVLFITSPASNVEANYQLEAGVKTYNELSTNNNIEFSIRPHPYFKNYSISVLNKKYKSFIENRKIFIDTEKFDLSLNKASVLIFAEISTTLFEAISYNKRCILLELKNDSSYDIIDLYKIKRHKANQILELIEQPEKMEAHEKYLANYKKILGLENTFERIELEINSI